MTFSQLLLDGLLGSVFAAATLASIPTYQAQREGWLSRFGWFFIRYTLPWVSMLIIVTWILLRH